jgi:hypothetical protein
MVRAWVGVGSLCSFFYVVVMCLAWYGSQWKAGVVRCLWLRIILSHLCFVGDYFSVSGFSPHGTVSFVSFIHVVILYFSVQANKHHEHVPRFTLVRYFLLLLRRGGRRSLQPVGFSVHCVFGYNHSRAYPPSSRYHDGPQRTSLDLMQTGNHTGLVYCSWGF